ncbi:MAG: hypothetical protein ACKV2T_07295 [Kofleriaceae bacterium]
MIWRVPPFDAACDELEAYVRATYAPLGFIVAGSIVRGEAGATSDFESSLADGWLVIEHLARHVVGVDTFFEWSSPRDPVGD